MSRSQENTLLFFDLIRQGNTKEIKEMIEDGYPVNERFVSGITPLIAAAYHGHLDIVKILVEAGADVNLWDEERDTPILCAINFGFFNLVDYLLPLTNPEVLEMIEDLPLDLYSPRNKPI